MGDDAVKHRAHLLQTFAQNGGDGRAFAFAHGEEVGQRRVKKTKHSGIERVFAVVLFDENAGQGENVAPSGLTKRALRVGCGEFVAPGGEGSGVQTLRVVIAEGFDEQPDFHFAARDRRLQAFADRAFEMAQGIAHFDVYLQKTVVYRFHLDTDAPLGGFLGGTGKGSHTLSHRQYRCKKRRRHDTPFCRKTQRSGYIAGPICIPYNAPQKKALSSAEKKTRLYGIQMG